MAPVVQETGDVLPWPSSSEYRSGQQLGLGCLGSVAARRLPLPKVRLRVYRRH